MQNESSGPQVIRFGTFELDVRAGELRKRGVKIGLQEQPLRILEMLLAHPGQLVTREELRSRLWPSDTFVDFDHGLNKAINKLREALGDSAESPRFVETLAKRGYRFIEEGDAGRIRSPHQGGGTTRMQNESSGAQIIRFSTFELDVRAGELRKQGVKIKLQEQPLRILEMLLAHPGQLVTREELRDDCGLPTPSWISITV